MRDKVLVPMLNNRNDKLTETEILETETTSPESDIIQKTALHGRIFSSLKHREYRYLWSGALLSNIGTWIQFLALTWFVLQLTDSEFALGLVGFASGAPMFFLALIGGVIADRYERRSLLIITQSALMVLALVLGMLVLLEIAGLTMIIALTLAAGVATSFGFPAWLALIPETVPEDDLMNAVALNSAQFNAARLIGPAVAGFLVSQLGIAAPFFLNALSFLAVIIALLTVKPRPSKEQRAEEGIWSILTGGIKYARANTSVAALLISIGVLTTFGLSHTALIPVFARDILGMGAQAYGILLAASGLGAVIGALTVAGLSDMVDKKVLIKLGMFSYSIFLFIFAFSDAFIISALAQFGIGVSFLTTVSTINTSLQSAAPAYIRGRIMSLYIWAFLGISPIGFFLIGTIARLIGSPTAVAINASIVAVLALILYLRSSLLDHVE